MDVQIKSGLGGAGNTVDPRPDHCEGVAMDSLPTRLPNAPKRCAIEGCDTSTHGRRCPAHQAQLERNLATLAGGER